MTLKIKTNNRERELLSLHEFPLGRQCDLRSQFDWLDEEEFDSPGFFTYKGRVHHISQYLACDQIQKMESEFSGWHGYESDSFFSGTVIRVSDDGETVVVGSYCS